MTDTTTLTQAVHWDGTATGATPIINWILSNSEYTARFHDTPAIHINTATDTKIAAPGAWIVLDDQGEFRVMYESVDMIITALRHAILEADYFHGQADALAEHALCDPDVQ